MKTIKTLMITVAFMLLGTSFAWAGSWVQTETRYRYINDDGTCLTNTWLQDNGKWYFLGEDGWMAVDTIVEGYQLGADGAEVTGAATIISQFPQVILQTALQPATQGGTQNGSAKSAANTTTNTTANATETQAGDDKSVTYVLNKNTKKFHKPSCSSVGDMAAKNRLDSSDSRETIIGKGYQACKRCKP